MRCFLKRRRFCRISQTNFALHLLLEFLVDSSIMVKVLALSVFHKTPAATTELASAFELSQFGFFQRGTVQVRSLLH
jgi:hypothetical protein